MEIVRLCVAGMGLRHKRGYDILFNLPRRGAAREKGENSARIFALEQSL